MNYLKQIKGFSLRRRVYPISCSAIALYYLLLEQFNMVGFPERLPIPLGRLISESGLGKTALCRARRELVEKGYLTVNQGNSSTGQSTYSMITLDPAMMRTPNSVKTEDAGK